MLLVLLLLQLLLLGLLILVFRQLGHRFSYNVIFATAAIGTVASNLYMLTQLRLRLLRTTLLLVFLFHVVTDCRRGTFSTGMPLLLLLLL